MAGAIIPPGGWAGFSQMTPASRAMLSRGSTRTARAGGRRRRRKGSTKAKGRVRARARSTGRKIKFGSPAWQKKYRVGAFAKRRK